MELELVEHFTDYQSIFKRQQWIIKLSHPGNFVQAKYT